MKGIRELFHTSLHRAVMIGLDELAVSLERKTVHAARGKPFEEIRYSAGLADGVRLAIAALQPPKDNDGTN